MSTATSLIADWNIIFRSYKLLFKDGPAVTGNSVLGVGMWLQELI